MTQVQEQEQQAEQQQILVQDAALLASFYSQRDKVPRLIERLVEQLRLTPVVEAVNEWQDEERFILLRSFDAEAAHDTTVVQLRMSAPGVAEETWTTMCWRLGRELDDEYLKFVWGYSLLYQASLAEGVSIHEPALAQLIASVRPLQSERSTSAPILAQTKVLGSHLSLTRVPLGDDGLDAGMVYVVLAPRQQESEFVSSILLGPHAKLLMPDLIAHKGYYQTRQYRKNKMKSRYQQAAQTLRQTTNALLSDITTSQDSSKLYTLTKDYKGFLTMVPLLDELHLSLDQQVHTYRWWRQRAKMTQVLDFHDYHLSSANRELELLIVQGKDVLEAAKTTVDMVQANLDREQGKRNQWLQTFLSVAGAALAVPQLIDRVVIGALLDSIYQSLSLTPPADGYSTLLLFAIQAALTLLIALLVGLIVRWKGG